MPKIGCVVVPWFLSHSCLNFHMNLKFGFICSPLFVIFSFRRVPWAAFSIRGFFSFFFHFDLVFSLQKLFKFYFWIGSLCVRRRIHLTERKDSTDFCRFERSRGLRAAADRCRCRQGCQGQCACRSLICSGANFVYFFCPCSYSYQYFFLISHICSPGLLFSYFIMCTMIFFVSFAFTLTQNILRTGNSSFCSSFCFKSI